MPLRRRSAKKMARRTVLNGFTNPDRLALDKLWGPDERVVCAPQVGERSPVAHPSMAVTADQVHPSASPQLALAAQLKSMAIAPPVPPLPPKRGRGRPKVLPVVEPVALSRQERRYRERMLAKATAAWDKASVNGALVVGGQEVADWSGREGKEVPVS